MAKRGKGSSYEREMSVALSLWYSGGKREDLLWRSAMSGGRATVRAKAGKSTANQQGDLTPTDPSIYPLTNLVSIELKRGYNAVTPMDAIDLPERNKTRTWEDFVTQCQRESEDGGKPYWWLIFKRDRREASITLPTEIIQKYADLLGKYDENHIVTAYNGMKLITTRLDKFLKWFDPETVFGPYKEE